MAKLSKELLVHMLKQMLEIRCFEEKIVDAYARGTAVGLAHLSIGQEAVAVGACANLRKEDFIVSNHRGHGHCIAKGGDPKLMFAEFFGREAGYCKAKGGSMHIASLDIGDVGAMGIVASGIPISVGVGLSIKFKKTDQVVVCFFGDAASNQGAFHEALNLASVHKVPVIFVCENNLYGISVSQKRHQAIKDIAVRAKSYNMPGVVIDGNDVIAVYEAVRQAAERAKKGEGPTLIECKTYRWRGHHEGDPGLGIRYRTKEEMAEWREKCPIKCFKRKLLEDSILSEAEIEQMEKDMANLIDEAAEYAQACPWPKPEEALSDLFAD